MILMTFISTPEQGKATTQRWCFHEDHRHKGLANGHTLLTATQRIYADENKNYYKTVVIHIYR